MCCTAGMVLPAQSLGSGNVWWIAPARVFVLLGRLPAPPCLHVEVDANAHGDGHEKTHHDEPPVPIVGRLCAPGCRGRSQSRAPLSRTTSAHVYHTPTRAASRRRGGLRLEGRLAPRALNSRHGPSIAPPVTEQVELGRDRWWAGEPTRHRSVRWGAPATGFSAHDYRAREDLQKRCECSCSSVGRQLALC